MSHVRYYIHGRGRGHASRSLPIARRLVTAGHHVTVFGGGDARDLLDEVPGWRPRDPLLPGPSALARLPLRTAADVRDLRRARPDLVISDGDQAVLLAAQPCRVPSVAIGHDLVFTCCALPAGLSPAALRYERANAAIPTHAATRRVAVHFLPIEPTRPGTWVARPDGDPDAVRQIGGHFVAYFRDANGAAVVARMRSRGKDVRWYGPGATTGDGQPSPFADRSRFQEELRTARGVVGSAGSNLVAECVLHGKPLLALYRDGDTEQALNAALAIAADVAMGSSIEQVAPATVDRFVERAEAGDFATVALASDLRPVSDVVTELVGTADDRPR